MGSARAKKAPLVWPRRCSDQLSTSAYTTMLYVDGCMGILASSAQAKSVRFEIAGASAHPSDASLISRGVLLRSIPWTGTPYGGGWNAPLFNEADQGVLRVDQD